MYGAAAGRFLDAFFKLHGGLESSLLLAVFAHECVFHSRSQVRTCDIPTHGRILGCFDFFFQLIACCVV
jgi:hypothetical protein